jgi:hypothetical protein
MLRREWCSNSPLKVGLLDGGSVATIGGDAEIGTGVGVAREVTAIRVRSYCRSNHSGWVGGLPLPLQGNKVCKEQQSSVSGRWSRCWRRIFMKLFQRLL